MVQYKNLPNFPNLPQRRGRGGGKERGGWVGGREDKISSQFLLLG